MMIVLAVVVALAGIAAAAAAVSLLRSERRSRRWQRHLDSGQATGWDYRAGPDRWDRRRDAGASAVGAKTP